MAFVDYNCEKTKYLNMTDRNEIKRYIRTELIDFKWDGFDDLIIKINA